MNQYDNVPPHKAHVFICTGCKFPGSQEDSAKNFRSEVKAMAKERWGKNELRVSGVQCLGQCERGISCVVYPQTKWFLELRPGEEKNLLDQVDKLLQ